jgi:hypothetical protein
MNGQAMAALNQSEGNQDIEEDPLGLSDEDAERHAKHEGSFG